MSGQQHKHTKARSENDDRLAECVEPAVARQHGGHHVRDVQEGPAFLEIARRHMIMRRRTGVADGRQFDSGRYEKRAPDEADD